MTCADEFVQRARSRREAMKLSQAELARRMTDRLPETWYQVTVARTENGSRPLRLDEAAAMAEVLGLAQPFSADTSAIEAVIAERIAEINEQTDQQLAEMRERLTQANGRAARVESALRGIRAIVNREEAH